MANLNIHDEDGDSWYTNSGEFRMPHPTRVGLFFEPGQATRVNTDAWIESQPVLVVTEDPLGAPVKSKAKAEHKADDKKP